MRLDLSSLAPGRLGGRIVLASLLFHVSFASAQDATAPRRPPTFAEIAERYRDQVEIRRDQVYASGGNRFQMVDVYLPKQRKSDRPLPVVAFVHGGGWAGGSRLFFTARACDYAATGDFVAVCVGYRLTSEASWPAQIHDCKAAIRWIRGHAEELNVNPDRIGVFGGSAGAHLAALLGTSGNVVRLDGDLGEFTNLPSRVQCVVNICGPADLTKPVCTGRSAALLVELVTKLLGGTIEEKPDVAREASPITYVSAATPPMLTIHGTKDSLVDFQQSVAFDEALKKAGAKSLLVPMLDVDHNFSAGAETLRRIRQFFDIQLRDSPGEVSTTPIPRSEAIQN